MFGAAVFSLAVVSLEGCFHPENDCEKLQNCAPEPTGGGGSGTGGTGGAPPECIPGVASAPVDDTCGVFVSAAGKDTNEGKKSTPKKTLAGALAAANGAPVYVCVDGLNEAVSLTEDATVYGGLDCAKGWTYVGLNAKTPWTAGAGEIPLRIASGARAKLEDVAITAADATTPGGSSIAVLAEVGTQLGLARCNVSAGNGAEGATGDTPMDPVTGGVDGNPGKDACASDMDQTGGSSAVLSCDGTPVNGGGGGQGNTSTGGAGSPGLPFNAASGTGGMGQIDAANACTAGGDGAPGMTGAAGPGAPMSLGTLGPDGPLGVSGGDGKAGAPGQGGGGGGGGKACMSGKAGASGGSGGSGACGGAGGKGGKPGGSSIGIVSLGAKLTLDTANITTKAGGKGGPGGAGQLGGKGGAAGPPGMSNDGSAACAGGKGGDGGPGGKGGGGLGGHSIGIAHVGEAPNTTGATITVGAPGDGGEGEGLDGKGASGVATKVQGFGM
jgi:hypothetical protein